MSEKELQTLGDAIKHAETMEKAKNKPKERRKAKPFRLSKEVKASNVVPSDEYRENYERVFGHK